MVHSWHYRNQARNYILSINNPHFAVRAYFSVLLFFSVAAQSATPTAEFSSLTMQDGLPGETVRQIKQDQHGFIWFGTLNGLVRFDGYRLTQVKDNNGQSLGDIRALHIGSDGNLWIGSIDQGLFYYQYGLITHIELSDQTRSDSITVYSLAEDHNKRLWVGTDDGLFVIDIQDQFKVSKPVLLDDHPVRNLTQWAQNGLIASNQQAVYWLDTLNRKSREIPVQDPGSPQKNHYLYADTKGDLWLARENGLYQYQQSCQCFAKSLADLDGKEVYSIIDDGSNLWVGTLFSGLYQYHFKDDSISHYTQTFSGNSGLSDNNVMSLFSDKSGVLWLGTFNNGINYFDPQTLSFGLINKDSPTMSCSKSQVVYDVYEEKPGLIWLSSDQGLVRIKPEDDQCTLFQNNPDDPQSLAHNLVLSAYKDHAERFWVGTTRGLSQLDTTTGQFDRLTGKAPATGIFFSLEYQPDKLLLGARDGLYVYDINQAQSRKISSTDRELNNTRYYKYTKKKDGSFVFATDNGLAFLDTQDNLSRIHPYGGKPELIKITAIHADDNGGLWVGAEGQRFIYLKQDGQVLDFSNQLELFAGDIEIRGILPFGDEILWISSNSGLFEFNIRSSELRHYAQSDGLQGSVFLLTAVHKSKSGKLYFGGRQGLNSFFPADISRNTTQRSRSSTNRSTQAIKPQVAFSSTNPSTLCRRLNWVTETILSDLNFRRWTFPTADATVTLID